MPFLYPVKRTLILVAQPFYLNTADLQAIRQLIIKAAPDLEVVIVGNADNLDLLDKKLWANPTLTVSFGPTKALKPRRGPIFANQAIPKIEQYRRLSAAGIATPKTGLYSQGMQLDESAWGPLLILKPADLDNTSSGHNLRLIRTTGLNELGRQPHDLPNTGGPMLVQQFIETGPQFSVFRNLTLFGETLYQSLATARDPHPPLDSPDTRLDLICPEPPRSQTVPAPSQEADVMAFAKQVASVFPTTPLLGLDIVREASSGRLFVIEVNAGGNVWHFSSPRTARWRSVERTVTYVRLFNPYQRAAEVLVATARKLAQ